MPETTESQPLEQQTPQDVTADRGSEDEAVLALQKAPPEAESDPETPTDEPAEEADEESEDADSEEADEADDTVDVEYEGKSYKLPPELKDAVLRKADYSRRMAEVSTQKKDFTARIETAEKLIAGAESYAKVLAKAETLDAQIAEFKDVDFDRMEVDDPGRASLLAVKLLRLQRARDQADGEAAKVKQQLDQDRAKTVDGKRADMVKTLAKDLPGWGDELGVKVTKYALSKGYTEADLQAVTDPQWVIAMDKARRFDATQDSKAAVKAKAKDAPPVAKPGAKRPAVNAADDAHAKFRKSRSDEDAIAALESRNRR